MGNVEIVLREIREHAPVGAITAWRHFPPRPPRYGVWPESLDARLSTQLRARGMERPYTHQEEALDRLRRGEHVVIVTPTASGKTLCYNVPVVQRILEDPTARALYIFPTKALAQDQMNELHGLTTALEAGIKTFTYDGDTPQSARQAIRNAGHVVITNPDMLHTAILPQHTRWIKLFEHLRYVVVDELHTYRGVFGSHVANVLRRLKRICEFYGSQPQFICCSATIANPRDIAEVLVNEPFSLIDNDGSPKAEKHLLVYNPPVVNRELGIRRSSLLEARTLAQRFLQHDVQTILFARSRLSVEVLVTYLKHALKLPPDQVNSAVRGYRGGYLPNERREIEAGLRNGSVRAVVSTNALELGIDVGQLEAAILVGYPGALASTWQQAGRAGRRSGTSVAILVASSTPLDQYIASHPEYLFSSSVEGATANPSNPLILNAHVKCGAFELPFADGELLGNLPIDGALGELEGAMVVHHVGGLWHWATEKFPAVEISLRSVSAENVVIIDTTRDNHVIGEMDRISALTMLHDGAIYLHEGVQFHVDHYDVDEQKAYVRRVEVDYYTDAELDVDMRMLDTMERRALAGSSLAYGEVAITIRPSIYKKIKFETHENIGSGTIHLPASDMHTLATWLELDDATSASLPGSQLGHALQGLRHLLSNVAPLYAMCDPRDVEAVIEIRSPLTRKATVYLYDAVPGGVGLAERLYAQWEGVLRSAQELVAACPCQSGCPSCVGPAITDEGAKQAALTLCEALVGQRVLVH
ncbi:MAG TPA: DEAD/DEAH box helicase [Chloroflexota bacterium]